MKIYTRSGDGGETSLIGGVRLPKHHLRIEAYGTLDELIAWIGMLRASQQQCVPDDELITIQGDLMACSTIIATHPTAEVPDGITAPESDYLENAIDRLEASLPLLKAFILPGGDPVASTANIARCVCRRAERAVIRLGESEKTDTGVTRYLNRLSDYLFILTRCIMHKSETEEVKWEPGKPGK